MGVGVLEITLINAKGLQDTDILSRMDPYVVAEFRNQERKSSVAREQGGCPSWNEKLRFRAEYQGGGGGDYKVVLSIMDKDTFSRDDFVGQATELGNGGGRIYVEDLLAIGVENGTAEIHPRKYSITLPDHSYRGEIQVAVSFALQAKVEDREDYGGWKQSDY